MTIAQHLRLAAIFATHPCKPPGRRRPRLQIATAIHVSSAVPATKNAPFAFRPGVDARISPAALGQSAATSPCHPSARRPSKCGLKGKSTFCSSAVRH
jgi:hypothetical protein